MNGSINNIIRYSDLFITKGLEVTPPVINAYLPEIADSDYENGYIVRTFLQKVNDDNSPIVEINSSDTTEIISNGYYRVISIKWRITGKPQEIMDSNLKSINLVSTEIKNLKLYLPNLLQFAKV
jgi:hypothetical protein